MAEPTPFLSIVVPTYNERDNLEPLVRRIFAALDPRQTELLIIDDNSPDGTAAVAEQLAREFPIRCLVRRGERGLATAVIYGMRQARGELIVVMDADLSHPPEAIPDLLKPLDDPNVPMTIGSRFVAGGKVDLKWPLHRRLNSWVARLLARPLTPVKDMMAGFFCVRRREMRFDHLQPIGYKIALELIVRHGWKNVVEVPITFSERAAGATKLNIAEQTRYLRHLGRLYWHAAQHSWRPLIVFGIFYAVILTIVVIIRAEDTLEKGTTDFRDYWRTALHFRQTGQISSELGIHNYLPFFPIFMTPWSLLPLKAAAAVFTLFSIALLALTIVLAEILLNGRLGPGPRRATWAAVGLVLAYVHSCAVLGAVELLILFLIVATWFLVERGREWEAGLPLGLAVLIKVLPALLILFFLLKRRWRVAGGATGICLILGLGLPLLLLGYKETWNQYAGFYQRAMVEHAARATLTGDQPQKTLYSNQSLPIVLRRLLSHTNATPTDDPAAGLYVNFVELPQAAMWGVYLLCMFTLLAASIAAAVRGPVIWPPDGPAAALAVRAQFGVWCCLMILASPLVWTRYLLLAYWALAVVTDRGDRFHRVAGRYCRPCATAMLVWLAGVVLLAWPAARAVGFQLFTVVCLWGVLLRFSVRREAHEISGA